jgi:hypothetical protein
MDSTATSRTITCSGADSATGRRERVRAELPDEPDIDKLVQWLLDVAAARHAA